MSHHRHQSGCDVSLSQIVYRQVCRHSKESQVLLAHHACRASLYRFDVYRQTQYRSVLWPCGSQHPTPLIPHSSALLSQTGTRCVMARFHSPCEGAGLAVVVQVFHAVRFASAEAMNDVPEWPEHSRTCEYLLKAARIRSKSDANANVGGGRSSFSSRNPNDTISDAGNRADASFWLVERVPDLFALLAAVPVAGCGLSTYEYSPPTDRLAVMTLGHTKEGACLCL